MAEIESADAAALAAELKTELVNAIAKVPELKDEIQVKEIKNMATEEAQEAIVEMEQCAVGELKVPGETKFEYTCELCPLDQFSTSVDSLTCTACPIGSKTEDFGSSRISDCIAPEEEEAETKLEDLINMTVVYYCIGATVGVLAL